jgi:pSer/pThr/pTyr-binding forkhead associated (FHA) protein
MKYFKCGQCQATYKIDETKVTSTQAVVVCTECSAKNVIRFGPILVSQNKEKIQQFSLKEGQNTIGRKSANPSSDFLVEDEFVSRKHAVIHVENRDNKIFISVEDSGSLNGTFNKNKIKFKPGLKYPFSQEDYIIIGLTKLSLKIN